MKEDKLQEIDELIMEQTLEKMTFEDLLKDCSDNANSFFSPRF